MPPYSIIKDLFDFLDKKRDGVLDLTEWMDVFSQYDFFKRFYTQKKAFK